MEGVMRVRSRRAYDLRDALEDVSLTVELAARQSRAGEAWHKVRVAEDARPSLLAGCHVSIALHFASLGDRERALAHLQEARGIRSRTPVGGRPRPPTFGRAAVDRGSATSVPYPPEEDAG
jgi:hypothetical protein